MKKLISQPNASIQQLIVLADQASNFALHSKSANTIRGYKSDWINFTNWCKSNGLVSLPASSEVLALYLTAFSQVLKVATLSRHLASIGEAHRTAGLLSPTESKEVQLVWRGIRRTKGVKQEVKLPIMTDDLRKAFVSFRQDLKGLRDRSLLLLGYTGAFRRSELVSLDLSDLQFVPEGITITLRHSKTDQESEGLLKAIPYSSSLELCPVRSLQEWLRASSITEGALFRSMGKGNRLLTTRLSDRAVALVVKELIESQGGDSEKYSGHSLRAGFVSEAAKQGANDHEIMKQTGHHSREMVSRYVRHISVWQQNASTKLGL